MLSSSIASVAGKANPMGFKSTKSVVLVLVDGLGQANLNNFQGHAPNLMKALRAQPGSLRTECPSTTVVSITSLLTGVRSAEHGLIGYNVLDPRQDKVVNLLSGWEVDRIDPEPWRRVAPLSESTSNLTVVSLDTYRKSGFTSLTTGTASFIGEASIEERLHKAAKVATQPGQVVYCYVPELDQAGHRFGSNSGQWISVLEDLDGAFGQVSRVGGVSWVITGDHGMVDVSAEGHVYLETLGSLSDIAFRTGGDTRCAYLYLDEAADSQNIAAALAAELGSNAWVATWVELVQSGWQTEGADPHSVPDLVLLARTEIAFYDRRSAKPTSLKMIGHHGSITDAETRVPLIRVEI